MESIIGQFIYSKEHKGNRKNLLCLFKLQVVLMIFMSGSALKVSSQDAHFSQFYASPLTLNPAIAGTYTGTFRISAIYRDQWRSAVDDPLKTFAVSGDVKFNVNYGNKNVQDIVALGITFFGDRVSSFDLNTNQIMLTAAYHKSLDKKTKQYLGIGIQGGIFQKTINYEDLTFQDQFNAIDGYTLVSGENLPPNNRAYADINMGVYYSITPNKSFSFHAGAGYFHATKPNISFFNTPDIIDPQISKTDILQAKWSVHTGASIKTGNRMSIQPRVNALVQGPHSELNLGATFRYKISKTAGQYLLLGPYLRGVKNYNNFGMESVIGMFGLEMNNFILGFSYDQNVGSLVKDRKSLSSLEISLIYIGEYHNDDNFCPQW
ncbi:MAG: PorP/SprF family type IX secretion system membrane protein [Saprospiraceae bacterium]|nr:PorP/SprF family type IX secretion system membrane protein [Saprospiraceae bacterium]